MYGIVITTINKPTQAIRKYLNLYQSKLYVVGDMKTPANWSCHPAEFIPVDKSKVPLSIEKFLPYNHYSRKMIGYLHAINDGYLNIVDTDDDNIPYDHWGFPQQDSFISIKSDDRFINIYKYFTDQFIWPRGYPLDMILSKNDFECSKHQLIEKALIGVWQGLADKDPDVDAIYRLTINKECTFNIIKPVAINHGNVTPFNSQNTFFTNKFLELLYLPVNVSFRFTDILRSYVAQPILWAANSYLGFCASTVYQERNPHNYLQDFQSEIPMYINCRNIVELIIDTVRGNYSVSDNLYEAYKALSKNGFIPQNELYSVEAWLQDLARFKK